MASVSKRHAPSHQPEPEYGGMFEGLTYAALKWPRYAWMCILVGLIIFTWIMAAIWQWIMMVLIVLLAGVVISWFVMMWRRARLEADGYTKAEAYRAYLAEEEALGQKDENQEKAAHANNDEDEDDDMSTIECQQCHRPFVPESAHVKFCSKACVKRSNE